ncbi:M57 family metalloprotease [Maribacter sp. 2-571]|uniref:M57 family metalloprotease n=1 Tax=Maribacter sp. 2-571 TaxID=3417569 RepID=UPI003D334897
MKKALLSMAVIAIFSCTKESTEENRDSLQTSSEWFNEPIIGYEMPQKDIAYLQALGFSDEYVSVTHTIDESGDKRITYNIDDIMIYPEDLPAMLPKKSASETGHYRMPLIASNGFTYRIYAFTNNNAKANDAVNRAIDNYNLLFRQGKIGFNFQRLYNYDNRNLANIRIYFNDLGPRTTGRTGFPVRVNSSFVRPFSNIQVNRRMITGSTSRNYPTDRVEHTITHEIGHTMGLRHTDWFSRSSCANPNPEPWLGAVHIPGTPSQFSSNPIDANSLMNACSPLSAPGEFTAKDKIALDRTW